jgi:hypothetical protein
MEESICEDCKCLNLGGLGFKRGPGEQMEHKGEKKKVMHALSLGLASVSL